MPKIKKEEIHIIFKNEIGDTMTIKEGRWEDKPSFVTWHGNSGHGHSTMAAAIKEIEKAGGYNLHSIRTIITEDHTTCVNKS